MSTATHPYVYTVQQPFHWPPDSGPMLNRGDVLVDEDASLIETEEHRHLLVRVTRAHRERYDIPAPEKPPTQVAPTPAPAPPAAPTKAEA